MSRARTTLARLAIGLLAFAAPQAQSSPGDTTSTARIPTVTAAGPALTNVTSAGPLGMSTAAELEAARTASGRCGTCHPQERTEFARGPHPREGVRCTSCHRGNDNALDRGSAHVGLVGRPARVAIAGLCGSCHSDPERMKIYGLPVDQVALYQTSGHGRMLAKGDDDVATCIDCHGTHESLPSSDARSHTHPTNVDHICSRCHGDERTVAGARTKKDVTSAWTGSVHGPAGASRGTGPKPGCTDCHGFHGAAPPATGASAQVCGHCHDGERRAFDDGAHGPHLDPGVRPECITCHGAHAIREVDPQSLVTSCEKCHEKGSAEAAMGGEMWREYEKAEAAIVKAEGLIARADEVPLPTEDYHARVRDAREELARIATAGHAARLTEVREAAMRARSVGEEVQESVDHKLGLVAERWLMLAAFWLFAGLLLVVLHRWRRFGTLQ